MPHWKRYRGGMTPNIRTYDFKHHKTEQVIAHRSINQNPMWLDNNIYFLSDRGKHKQQNLWVYDMDNKNRKIIFNWHLPHGKASDRSPDPLCPGPKVCITNEWPESGGDMFVESFRQLNAGLIIGKRTAGSLSSTSGYYLMDKGIVISPSKGPFNPRGKFFIENIGPGRGLSHFFFVLLRVPSWLNKSLLFALPLVSFFGTGDLTKYSNGIILVLTQEANVEIVIKDEVKNVFDSVGINDIGRFIEKEAIMMLLAKESKFRAEYNLFKNKYNAEFEEYEQKVRQSKVEDFETEDDLMDWEFAFRVLESIEKKKKALGI
jgi:hypothetical protein